MPPRIVTPQKTGNILTRELSVDQVDSSGVRGEADPITHCNFPDG